ncbi:hypothetical protein SAMN05444166_7812 [Singulisphaera sp. GP187]|uniref:hypothetical protein n=1 Tax=Singulisphaera sp. GP187 TaxID=1882752 RepID=UPI000927F86D|nr:hypothetical protein [Singulisphaera sp. GP187]SIO65733.1 hypothetical protein SAMN05444166_7812 [Singulisphaera sp. GP187]
MIFRRVSCPVASLALTLALALAGCSRDSDLVAAVPAAGTITYKGKPLESGNLQLIPEKGRSASGAIKDGKFVLTTYTDNDGAIPGKHTVTVTAYKEVKVKGENEPQQVLIIHEKYANPTSSGLVLEIPSGGKQDIEIKLD